MLLIKDDRIHKKETKKTAYIYKKNTLKAVLFNFWKLGALGQQQFTPIMNQISLSVFNKDGFGFK